MDGLNRKDIKEFKQSEKFPVIVVLDNIRSLHNIGSVFRTCDAFLLTAIYLCGISATPPHREIRKTALGAELAVDWKYFSTTLEAVDDLKRQRYRVWAVEQAEGSVMLQDFTIENHLLYAFVFGNEVRGVSQGVIDLCMGCIEIPQFGTKHSFNVSVSAGIVLWETYRQMKQMNL